MKKFLPFVRATIVGGVWFLIPIVVLVMLFGKVRRFTSGFVTPLAEALSIQGVLGVFGIKILTILVIVMFCFLAGLFALTPMAKKMSQWLEYVVLSNLPGYSFMRSMGGSFLGLEDRSPTQVVLARIEDSWQLGFLVDHVPPDLHAVFVPGAPSPWSGSVYFMTADRFKRIDISPGAAMRCVKNLGIGSSKLLSGKIS